MTTIHDGPFTPTAQHLAYYDYDAASDVTCPRCSWTGICSDHQNVVDWQLVEVVCPACSSMLLVVPFPTLVEGCTAAARGNHAAAADLAQQMKSMPRPENSGRLSPTFEMAFDDSSPWAAWSEGLPWVADQMVNASPHVVCFAADDDRYLQIKFEADRTAVEVSAATTAPTAPDASRLRDLGFLTPGATAADGSISPNWARETEGCPAEDLVELLRELARCPMSFDLAPKVHGYSFAL